ncbi:MAG TPA: ribosome rescue GTPase HflX [Steroidobacteraceae bacterium]|nr:ribosome rescue GTPase HflX [Steroidobacteraceae bacterium]
MFERPGSGERAILVCVGLGRAPEPDRIEEFQALARSAGAVVLETMAPTRKSADPRFLIGSGKVEELRQRIVDLGADLVVIDGTLSPSQERNLEKELKCRVLDRAGLILDIFAQRARTFEGKLQVELAQLQHMSTRLVRGWTHLERQRGGGIGLRGPGETQLETDRRLIGKRIKALNDRLDKVLVQRETTRQERRRAEVPTIALVGYTNAGKSTLFNCLTRADAYAADQLFATLDPTVRRLHLAPGLETALADTVGFVRDLPHELVAAFRSTLQEAREADLLLHVIDAADPERAERITQVNDVLESIGAQDLPQIAVYNKIDRTGEMPRVETDEHGRIDRVWLSAHSGAGVDLLLQALHQRLGADLCRCTLRIPPRAGRARARLFEAGAVVGQRMLDDGVHEVDVSLRRQDLERICRDEGIELPAECSPCAGEARFLQSTGSGATRGAA